MVLVRALHRHLNTFRIFHRPVNGRQLVPPSALRDHRDHHQFLSPSCLCLLIQSLSEEPVFKEAAIYIPVFGPFAGEHVAECVESRCGYLGQSLFLVHIAPITHVSQSFSVPGAEVYHAECSGEGLPHQRSVSNSKSINILRSYADAYKVCPPPVYHQWELQSKRTLKRTYAVAGQ